MCDNIILNHFNNIVSSSNFDINKTTETYNQYIIFEVDRFIINNTENKELTNILSKYCIIFDSSTNNIQFTPFFKLIQEILSFNYNYYCKTKNNGQGDNKLLYTLSQFFKQPFIDEQTLSKNIQKANLKTLNNCKISKLYDLNYNNLPFDFANPTFIQNNVFKIRGGKVKYQGTWTTFNFAIKLLKLVGGFDVLKNLLNPIFFYMDKIFINFCFLEKQKLFATVSFVLHDNSVIWKQFTNISFNQIKIREYKSFSRIGKKRGKYNKNKDKKINKKTDDLLSFPKVVWIDEEIPIVNNNANLKFKIKKKRNSDSLENNKKNNNNNKNSYLMCDFSTKPKMELDTFSKTPFFTSSESTLVPPENNFFLKPKKISSALLSVCNDRYDLLVKKQPEVKKAPIKLGKLKANSIRNESIEMTIIESNDSFDNSPTLAEGYTPIPNFEKIKSFKNVNKLTDANTKNKFKQIIPSPELISFTPHHQEFSTPLKKKHTLSNTSEVTLLNISPSSKISYDMSLLNKINEPTVFDSMQYSTTSPTTTGNNYGYCIRTNRKSNNDSEVKFNDNMNGLMYNYSSCEEYYTNTFCDFNSNDQTGFDEKKSISYY